MATFTFEVKSYTIWLSPSIGYGRTDIAGRAMIICAAGDGGKDTRCIFRFQDRAELASAAYDEATRTAHVFVHAAQYPWYVDLLRNERPVRCVIDKSDPKFSRLVTGDEPVGEGEQIIRA